MPQAPLAERLADYAARLRFDDLPAAVVHEARRVTEATAVLHGGCTAAALLDGDVTEATFEPSRFTDPALVALTAKVKVRLDDALTPRYPRRVPNRLTLTLADGRRLVKEVEFPRGHARNPMSDAEVEHKFRKLVEPRYGKAKADAILAACRKLEELKEAGDLVRLVGERPT
jgi:2-methylcitrate dehydratase